MVRLRSHTVSPEVLEHFVRVDSSSQVWNSSTQVVEPSLGASYRCWAFHRPRAPLPVVARARRRECETPHGGWGSWVRKEYRSSVPSLRDVTGGLDPLIES